jgi:hypothetical protein
MIDFELLKKVVQQIKDDVSSGDYTAIEDLLKDIPKERLIGFLTEGDTQ